MSPLSIIKRLVLFAAALLLVPLGLIGYQAAFTSNFHEILPGQFYRSAQLTPGELERRIDQYGIKTVVNLRGTKVNPGWYDDERRVVASRGIELVDFPMSSSQRLSPERALALVDLMKKAPKPILVHCLSGADRTGLASMIYLNQVAGMDEETAEWQLTPLYGHFGIPFLSPSFAMDETWEELEPLFVIEGS